MAGGSYRRAGVCVGGVGVQPGQFDRLGTVTLAGTVATPVLLLDRLTTAPPLGAAALNVTVPVDELPPVTLDGLSVSDVKGGLSATSAQIQ